MRRQLAIFSITLFGLLAQACRPRLEVRQEGRPITIDLQFLGEYSADVEVLELIDAETGEPVEAVRRSRTDGPKTVSPTKRGGYGDLAAVLWAVSFFPPIAIAAAGPASWSSGAYAYDGARKLRFPPQDGRPPAARAKMRRTRPCNRAAARRRAEEGR